jgi:hypothetical protein
MNVYIYYTLNFVILVGIVVALLYVLRKFINHRLDEKQQKTIGTVFPFVTMTFAFFLGFAIATLWKMYNDADTYIAQETDSLVSMYRLAGELPHTDELQKSLRDYVTTVRDDEWKQMAEGKTSDKADALQNRIWGQIFKLDPGPGRGQTIFSNLVKFLTDFNSARRNRLLLVDGSLPSFMWINLFVGCLFSIVCVYLMTQSDRKVQLIVDAILVAILVSNVYLIILLDKPFGGIITVSNKPFCATCRDIGVIEKAQVADANGQNPEKLTP